MSWFKRRSKPRSAALIPEAGAVERAETLIAEGRRAESTGAMKEALALYRQAAIAAPDYASAHLDTGIALAAIGELPQAIEAYRRAIALEPQHAAANYNLALVLQMQGDAASAETHLRTALAVRPDFVDALIALGNLYDATGRRDQAAQFLRSAIALRPDHAGAHNNLGTVLQAQGRAIEARDCFAKAIACDPAYAAAQLNLGKAHLENEAFDAAIPYLERAASLAPGLAEAHFHLGNLQRRRGDDAAAIASYRRALDADPGLGEVWNNLGAALHATGDLNGAAESLRSALARRPGDASAHGNLGAVLFEQGRYDEALASYRTALALAPANAEATLHMARLYRAQRKLVEAESWVRKAIALRPHFAAAHYELGSLFHQSDALPYYERALELDPDFVEARWAIAMAQSDLAQREGETPDDAAERFGRALTDLDAWFDERRVDRGYLCVGSLQPFYIAYRERNNRDLLGQYGNLCARLMRHWQGRRGLLPQITPAGATVRVGVVSAHVFEHSVWLALLRGWFAHLDPARVSLHVFYTGIRDDAETQWARTHASSFIDGKRGLEGWTSAILAERLDVIVYPEVGMDPLGVKLASMRLASVQAATWGHAETTGLPTIDYYLSAEDLEPAGAEAHYTERLVKLPLVGCCYEPLSAPEAAIDLAALGIEEGCPLLLCPGAPFKYQPEHDAVFVRIAQALGRCQFVFFQHEQEAMSDRLQARLRAKFEAAGLDLADYCRVLPSQPRPVFFGLMRRADVFLDTIGFSGFNTAMQAIECALPIVTVEGKFLRGRLASGPLRRMGLDELVADSDEAFVRIAVALARDPGYRQQIRERMVASRDRLFNRIEPIRALESFLVDVTRQPAPSDAGQIQRALDEAMAHYEAKRYPEAIAAFARVLALEPCHLAALYQTANAYYALGERERAASECDRALALLPDQPDLLVLRGAIASDLHEHLGALACFERAGAINPDLAGIDGRIAEQLCFLGRGAEAIAAYDRAIAKSPLDPNLPSQRLYFLNYFRLLDRQALFDEHRIWGEWIERHSKDQWRPHDNSKDPDRPLRIGLVSGDLRTHSVAFFIEGYLRAHDRERYPIHCFDVSPYPEDATTARLRTLVEHWYRVAALDPDALADYIRAQQIDVLVDLSGHTGHNRLLTFAVRPAPVQVSWFGYMNTTGLTAIDYRIDRLPPRSSGRIRRYYTEELVRIPSLACFTPSEQAPEVGPSPFLRNGRLTFACINQWTKVTAEARAVWAKILCDPSRPKLRIVARGADNPQFCAEVTAEFVALGVAPDQVEVRPLMPMAQFLAFLNEVDVALDTFPYGGGTTTLHSIWMGVPIIAMEGNSELERATPVMLRGFGLPEFVARSSDEYRQIGTRWAGNPEGLVEIRQTLRDRMRATAAVDAAGLARSVEAAFREMWRRWISPE